MHNWESTKEKQKISRIYLDPWCMNPKSSRAFDLRSRYLTEVGDPTSKITIFSIDLYAANTKPSPCSKKRGENRARQGIYEALLGVPWNWKLLNEKSRKLYKFSFNIHLFKKFTSKRIKSRIWKMIKGTFMTCPPMSCRLQTLTWGWASSEETTTPLSQSRYRIVSEEELDSLTRECLWIIGLYHFVQTRNAKHSAILQNFEENVLDKRCSRTVHDARKEKQRLNYKFGP